MRTALRLLVFFLVVPLAVGGTLLFLDQRGVFKLDHIEVILTKNTEQSRFMQPIIADLDAQLEKQRGQSLWGLDLDRMNAQLSSLPWIHDLQIRRNWPDQLEVKISPKEVRFLFVAKNGQFFPVLDDGTFLNPVSIESAPDVVLLRGEEFIKNKKLLQRALDALTEIPDAGSFSKKTISEIRYDSKEGFWVTLMNRGVQVKLGDEQFLSKADRISQVLDYLEANQFDARVIDANLTKKVLVRLRKAP